MSALGLGEIGLTVRQRRAGAASAATGPITIVNRNGCAVEALGGGVHRVTKTGGSGGDFDASAVSAVPMAGDFTLRVSPIAADVSLMCGVNSDPSSDDDFSSIDFVLAFLSDGSAHVFEDGNYEDGGWTYEAGESWWLTRRSGLIAYRQGGGDPEAGALKRESASAAILYFDSSLADTGAAVDVQLDG